VELKTPVEVKIENMTFKDLVAVRKALGWIEMDRVGDSALFNAPAQTVIHQQKISQAARECKKPVEIVLHGRGDIVVMSDGTRYNVDETGAWVKAEG
jgi:hypothetical protein